jgi:hypothetical protein
MVLLEIGLWKSFDRSPRYEKSMSPSENCDRILQKFVSGYVAYCVGNTYQSIVRTCLTGEFGSSTIDDAAFQKSVYEVVVEPLRGLMAASSRNRGE